MSLVVNEAAAVTAKFEPTEVAIAPIPCSRIWFTSLHWELGSELDGQKALLTALVIFNST